MVRVAVDVRWKSMRRIVLTLSLVTLGAACGDYGGSSPADSSVDADPYARLPSAYLKASNTDPGDVFGAHVAVSADGSTIAVAAPNEASEATGIDGNQGNSMAAPGFGAVYVFGRSGDTWAQQAYVKASIVTQGWFGSDLALSDDGSTLAVGASMDPQPDSLGTVYVFTRSGTTWSQQARLQSPNAHLAGFFGFGVALSGDGNTLAAGAYDENSIGSPETQTFAGAVHVFTRSGAAWSHQAGLKGARTEAFDYVGWTVELSADGNTLAFGAPGEAGGISGVDGNQADNSAPGAGAVYVATRQGTTWSQQAYVKPSNVGSERQFGSILALSADGSTLAAGSFSAHDATGELYVFLRSGSTWSEHAKVTPPNLASGDMFGASVALSADGSVLAVGATGEDSASLDPADNGAMSAGAVYTFSRATTGWSFARYIKAPTIDRRDAFGSSIGVSGDVTTLVTGAPEEASAATGIDGNQMDNSAMTAGAAYVFSLPN